MSFSQTSRFAFVFLFPLLFPLLLVVTSLFFPTLLALADFGSWLLAQNWWWFPGGWLVGGVVGVLVYR